MVHEGELMRLDSQACTCNKKSPSPGASGYVTPNSVSYPSQGASPIPIPIPEPRQVESSLPASSEQFSSGPSDKENVPCDRALTPPVLRTLVEIPEDVTITIEEDSDAVAAAVSDDMDRVRRQVLAQRCKRSNGRIARRFNPVRRPEQHLESEVRRRRTFKNLVDGEGGYADEESSSDESVSAGGPRDVDEDERRVPNMGSVWYPTGVLRRSVFLSA